LTAPKAAWNEMRSVARKTSVFLAKIRLNFFRLTLVSILPLNDYILYSNLASAIQ
jgi:hypothetical protein